MNDDWTDLEREIANIPLPHVSNSLNEQVFGAIRQIRMEQRNREVTVVDSAANRAILMPRSWIAIQTVSICFLCFMSFCAGRRFESAASSPTKPAEMESGPTNIVAVQAAVDPSAETAFRSLIISRRSTETIWGPADQLSLNTIRSSTEPQ